MDERMYDIIIVGKGPAGMSCGLYTTKANLKTLIIGSNESWLLKAKNIENYFGLENVTGETLLQMGEEQLQRAGVEVIDALVHQIDWQEGQFLVNTGSEIYHASSVLIATGRSIAKYEIPGLYEFLEKGVHLCSVTDGFFVRDRKVGVLGAGEYAMHEAKVLLSYTKEIVLLSNGKEMLTKSDIEQAGIPIITKKIQRMNGQERLEEVVFEDGTSVSLDALFVVGESANGVDLARKLGIEVKNDCIVVDADQQTSMPKLFAAGDCTCGFRQVAVAVQEGAVAAKQVIVVVRKDYVFP